MGQNQSQEEEPYHRRHYNETNKQIQRQNSLSLSSPNLLLHRDPSLRRANTLRSSSALSLNLGSKGNDPVAVTPTCNINNNTSQDPPAPFIRLLPIEKEPIYFDETEDDDDADDESFDEADDEEDGYDSLEEYNEIELHQRLAPSPYLLGRTFDTNSRQSQSDHYEQHTRDLQDFQVSKDEEEEDMSHLSPVSGCARLAPRSKPNHSLTARTFDHDHPRYFESSGEPDVQPACDLMQDQDAMLAVQRYQLYDRPVPRLQETTVVDQLAISENSDSTTMKVPFLDAIKEEDEALGHSRRGSSAIEEVEQSRTGRYDTAPLQQANNSSAILINDLKDSSHIVDTDTHQSAEELYHLTKADLNRRIQQAVQEVELKFTDRVQKLEAHTASLKAMAGQSTHGALQESDPAAMTCSTLANVSHQVGDLDARVDQMKSLIHYKLTDIETKVQELYVGQSKVTQTVDQVDLEQGPDEQPGVAGCNEQEPRNGSDILPIDTAAIMELRRELQAFGTRYHELNDGLLTDLMSQMRDAKLQLFGTVDRADEKLGRRIDRIDAELHAQLLNDIESRIQERVTAMEQMSLRLEQCFDKMDGRLGALETVLSSRRMRPESIYRLLNPQQSPAPKLDTSITQDWKLRAENDAASMTMASPSMPPTPGSKTTSGSTASSVSSIHSLSSSSSSYRDKSGRPARIITVASARTPDALVANALDHPEQRRQGTAHWPPMPHSAGPVPVKASWNRERAMTLGNTSMQRLNCQSPSSRPHPLPPQRSLTSATTPRTGSRPINITNTPERPMRRPSSYKELLHFWKAGGSTPDLLNNAGS
ncbi:hypothetical protein KVV02_003758 [Mortierella alpina]|uniref:Uncharacterized protein n=1 Tax=Mortierella alpina TaxID=64518 RepID=A0A9P7ZY77_MORAP|nr:hypothetical protein KVV02_003758 [Mortierella alpina]